MRLVIDGYNLIHQSPELKLAHQQGQGRQALAAAVSLYRRKKPHRLTLVFDGGPEPASSRASLHGVPVIYSGAGRSADQVIGELAGKGGAGITVVTDDRALAEHCRRQGAQVIPARKFAGLLMDAALGRTMAAEGDQDQGWDFTTKKKGPSRREPKASRQRRRKLEKL